MMLMSLEGTPRRPAYEQVQARVLLATGVRAWNYGGKNVSNPCRIQRRQLCGLQWRVLISPVTVAQTGL